MTRLKWGAEVFVYFNNDWEAFAVTNARKLAASFSRGSRSAARAAS